MQIGSAYSGLQAFDMVSKSVEMINDLNKSIIQENTQLNSRMINLAVSEQVSHPSSPETVHQIDVLA